MRSCQRHELVHVERKAGELIDAHLANVNWIIFMQNLSELVPVSNL